MFNSRYNYYKKLCTVFVQESVEGSDVNVDVSSPAPYIDSHDDSMHIVDSSVDGIITSSAPSTFDSIQPTDVLMSYSTTSVEAALEQTSSAALAVDVTPSPELPTFETVTSR